MRLLALILLLPFFGAVSAQANSGVKIRSVKVADEGGGLFHIAWRLSKTPSRGSYLYVERRSVQAGSIRIAEFRHPRRSGSLNDLLTSEDSIKYRIILSKKGRVASSRDTKILDTATSRVVQNNNGGGSSGGSDYPKLAPGQQECSAGVEDSVIDFVNRARAESGLPALSKESRLQSAARAHSIAMGKLGQMTHEGWIEEVTATGYPYRSLAQNVAFAYTNPETLVNAFLQSPGHRDNILSPYSSDIGVSCIVDATGTTRWTQDFGSQQ